MKSRESIFINNLAIIIVNLAQDTTQNHRLQTPLSYLTIIGQHQSDLSTSSDQGNCETGNNANG